MSQGVTCIPLYATCFKKVAQITPTQVVLVQAKATLYPKSSANSSDEVFTDQIPKEVDSLAVTQGDRDRSCAGILGC